MERNDFVNDSTWPVFAAVGGAVVAVLAGERVSLPKAVSVVVAGAIIGSFVVPAVAEAWGIRSLNLTCGLSFLCGMLGLQVATIINRQVARRGPQIVDAALEKATGVDVDEKDEAP